MHDILRTDIITSFFHQLEEGNKYAILHHLDHIYNQDDDIDFIVNCTKSQMLKFVKSFADSQNIYLVNHFTIDRDTYRFDLCYYNNNTLNKIELDSTCNSTGKDLLRIETVKLLKNRILVKIEEKKFYKISNQDEIEFYIKKKVYKGEDVLKYFDYFRSLDKTISKKFIIEKENKWSSYFSSIIYKTKYMKNKFLLLINRIYERPDLSICFLGPDGSGKSTIINEINKVSLFINNYYFHLKPFQNNTLSPQVVENPHSQKEYSVIKSYIKLIYFICQYNLGWLKNISKLKIKSSLIIFDRYFDDMLVDTKRYRYGGSVAVARFVGLLIPKPELYFVLTTDAKIIYKRKQEVSLEELERQVKEYKALCNNICYLNIDVNRAPEEITKEIVTIIMEEMNGRY